MSMDTAIERVERVQQFLPVLRRMIDLVSEMLVRERGAKNQGGWWSGDEYVPGVIKERRLAVERREGSSIQLPTYLSVKG